MLRGALLAFAAALLASRGEVLTLPDCVGPPPHGLLWTQEEAAGGTRGLSSASSGVDERYLSWSFMRSYSAGCSCLSIETLIRPLIQAQFIGKIEGFRCTL